jgi:hypothetical protein
LWLEHLLDLFVTHFLSYLSYITPFL